MRLKAWMYGTRYSWHRVFGLSSLPHLYPQNPLQALISQYVGVFFLCGPCRSLPTGSPLVRVSSPHPPVHYLGLLSTKSPVYSSTPLAPTYDVTTKYKVPYRSLPPPPALFLHSFFAGAQAAVGARRRVGGRGRHHPLKHQP